jgi:hypothetical protein
MHRIAVLDRKDMSPEQARAWDEATQDPDAPRGGPYPIYIRLPKLFAALQKLRACLAAGPLSVRERQIVNLTVARHWNARYPWFAQVRRSLAAGIPPAAIDAINAHATPRPARSAPECVPCRGAGAAGEQRPERRGV